MASTHDYEADVRNSDIQIYINGAYFHRSEAKISVMDSGYLLGDGVWEGIRLHKGKFLHLENHLYRLYKGAKLLDIKLNLPLEKVKQALIETVKINNMYTDVHIRLIVSRGIKKTPYQHPKVTVGPPNIVIIPEFKKVNINDINKGIALVLVKTIRDYRVQNPQINSLSKLNYSNLISDGYSFQIEMAYLFIKNKFKIKEVPIIFHERRLGKSKMSWKIIIEAFKTLLYLYFQRIKNDNKD